MFLLSAFTVAVCGSRDSKPIIGIDLGTTYSCVAVFQNGRIDVITNDVGKRTTRSVVSFTQKGRIVGDLADREKSRNPTNTIFSIKRLIGLRYSDESVQSEISRLPYKVVNENDFPFVEVDFEGKRTRFSPVQISGMILEKMKNIAEDFLGTKIERAVVTVPAYFGDSQRKATILAGRLAGLKVERILNEPTAAAFAYGLDNKGDKQLLVFDLGRETFDVTVLRVKDSFFEVLSTSGDSHLGGDDFDGRIVDFLVEEFLRKTGRDARKNLRALTKLRQAAIDAKHTLSQLSEHNIDIENVMEDEDLTVTLTRPKFEELCFDLFNRTLNSVTAALKASGLQKGEIDDVVLVGGSTRIPAVQNLLRKFFGGKELSKAINPDEAVAVGAAIQGAVLGGDENVSDILLMDVNPLSVGIEANRGRMSVIIPQNAHLPIMKKRNYTTLSNNQQFLRVAVYEGERLLAKDNRFLGRFNLTGIARAPRGVPRITVTFEKDSDGILKVTAEDVTTNVRQEITVYSDELSEEQRDEMIQLAKKMREQDMKLLRAKLAKNRFETYLRDVLPGVSDGSVSLTHGNKGRVTEIVKKWLKWVESHQEEEEGIYRQKLGEAIQELQPLIGDFPVPPDPNDKDESPEENSEDDNADDKTDEEDGGESEGL